MHCLHPLAASLISWRYRCFHIGGAQGYFLSCGGHSPYRSSSFCTEGARARRSWGRGFFSSGLLTLVWSGRPSAVSGDSSRRALGCLCRRRAVSCMPCTCRFDALPARWAQDPRAPPGGTQVARTFHSWDFLFLPGCSMSVSLFLRSGDFTRTGLGWQSRIVESSRTPSTV